MFHDDLDVKTGNVFKSTFNNSFQKFLVVEQMKKVIDESESESLSTKVKVVGSDVLPISATPSIPVHCTI